MAGFSLRMRRFGARLATGLALVGLLSSGLVGVSSASAAEVIPPVETAPVVAQFAEASSAVTALAGKDFNAAYIISDYMFYSTNAMSTAQIQAFLDAKCPTNNCIDNKSMTSTTRAATNMCPSAYTGATESFAQIIYKVQKSCGISAKVILVTLQKEQGLLNLQNPTALKLRKAMGMGCPDTSVCDSKYYGFFNQVYYAASQLKRYGLRTSDNISFRSKYQIGVPYPILLKPGTTCGTKSVSVKNKATTALYYYTPYTPNPAALNNLTGTGDACSSYGNRNFWVYFSSWFGSPIAGPGAYAIQAAYEGIGGPTGALGAKGTEAVCVDNAKACTQLYEHGLIYWTKVGGAWTVSGAIGDYFLARYATPATLGIPLTDANPLTTASNGPGVAQGFKLGTVHSSASGTYLVSGTMLTSYAAAGWVRGVLGWPSSDITCTLPGGACVQNFQHGAIYAPKTGAAQAITDADIAAEYSSLGGVTGELGLPTTAKTAITVPANGNGFSQGFAKGMIYKSAAGTFSVSAAMQAAYVKAGWVRGTLGWPAGDKTCTLPGGGCSQSFQKGTIYAPATGSAFAVTVPAIQTAYQAAGGAAGALGYPTTASTVLAVAKNIGGTAQGFQNGMIYSTSLGTFSVSGVIATKYVKAGWVRGSLGWPTGAQVCGLADGGCSQTFQKGTLYTLK